jgi:hypothetical protein
LAAVGEAVGREVEDGHDEGAGAESEGAGAETPVVGGTDWRGRERRHVWILASGCCCRLSVVGCWLLVVGCWLKCGIGDGCRC